MATRVRYHDHIERACASGPEMYSAMSRLVSDVATDARRSAPVDTPVSRGGAQTIAGWVDPSPDGYVGYVGWARRAYYLRFHERGWEHRAARPFLQPAVDRRRITS